MKIAQVCPYDFHRPGGVQYHIRDLGAALGGLGHQVTVIAPARAGGQADEPGVVHVGRCRALPFNRTRFEFSIALGPEIERLEALLAAPAFDVVHLHTPWTPLLPWQVLKRSSAANVATFHDVPPDTVAGAVTRAAFRRLGRALAPRLDALIATSDAPLAHLDRVAGEAPRILPPCVDLSRFAAAPEPFAQFRDGKVNLLFLGRLDRRKGILDLLQAYRRLADDGLPVRLIVVGEGDQRTQVAAFARQANLADVALIGPVAEADKPRWFATCDVFCSPALYGEGFGIVLVEAMASGKPVVACANRGYRTVLTGPASRFLVPPGDVGRLYETLKAMVLDEAARAEMAAWGRDNAAQYDAAQVAPRIVAVYREAIERAATR